MDKEPILLLTHGGWGSSLLESVKMIVGKAENVYEVPLQPEDTLQEYTERVKEQVAQLSWQGKLLILTDIKGGTTSNVALRLSREFEILALSGLNTAMILEAIMSQDRPYDGADGERIAQAGIDNCQVLKMPTLG